MKYPCVFKDHKFIDSKFVYVCEFYDQFIPENVKIEPIGLHACRAGQQKTNAHVNGIIFNKCRLTRVPQGLKKIFPNLRNLSIWDSTLKKVTKDDLADYKNFERIGLCGNKIKFLPGNLFEGFKRLEEVAFNGNQIELIEPNILDGLTNLKIVDFEKNPAYTKCYSNLPGWISSATLQDVKDELFVRFYRDRNNINDLLKVEEENLALKRSVNELLEKIDVQNKKCSKDMQSEIGNFIKNDKLFKDFNIQINDQQFSVHKILLAARSQTLADILSNNPDVENLNLHDIPEEVFEIILHFLYTDEFPKENNVNFLTLFMAAARLKINMLKDFAAKKLLKIIDAKSAFTILKLSNNYNHDELRQAAFVEIKNDHPKIEFKDDWANDPELVRKIIDAFKLKEEAVRKAEEEFKKLIL